MPDDIGGNVTAFGGNRSRSMNWTTLIMSGDNGPYATVSNALLAMCNCEYLRELLAYDEFSHRVVVTRPPPVPFIGAREAPGPYPRPATDTDITLIQGHIQRAYSIRVSQTIAQQAADAAAEQVRVHPVREYLASLKWDGVPRVATWLHVAFGVPADRYHEAIGTKFLVAAVRRVRQPGVKFDTMLVLEGLQELGKSKSCRALFGTDWFSDEMPDMRSRDAPISMLGRWGVEMSELGGIIRTEIEVVKAFLSRQVDRYREIHGRRFLDRPRQTMLMGTTNDKDYLRDTTGNRRFWPVACVKAEADWIAEVRDQLWAEAAIIEAEGETLWLDEAEVRKEATTAQAERMTEDVWSVSIDAYLKDFTANATADMRAAGVRIPTLLRDALGLPVDKQNRSAEMRVAGILKSAAWTSKVVWLDKRSQRVWLPPPKPDNPDAL
jgi:predicted P-loop ATPase